MSMHKPAQAKRSRKNSKAQRTKACEQLKQWAEEGRHIELTVVNSSISIRGTVRDMGHPTGLEQEGDFLFVSESREIIGHLAMLIWDKVTCEPGPFGASVHFHPQRYGAGVTLLDRGIRSTFAQERSAAKEQLQFWFKMKASLLVQNTSSLVTTFTRCNIMTLSESMFALVSESSKQIYLINFDDCASLALKRSGETTVLSMTSHTGHFAVMISDANDNPEEVFNRFRADSNMVN